MTGALQGFLVVAVIVAIGWGIGKLGIVSSRAERDLSTLVVKVMVPCTGPWPFLSVTVSTHCTRAPSSGVPGPVLIPEAVCWSLTSLGPSTCGA